MAKKVFEGKNAKRESIEYFWKFPRGTASIVLPGDGTRVVVSADPPKKKKVKQNG